MACPKETPYFAMTKEYLANRDKRAGHRQLRYLVGQGLRSPNCREQGIGIIEMIREGLVCDSKELLERQHPSSLDELHDGTTNACSECCTNLQCSGRYNERARSKANP